jgi:hypothetical protein
MGIEEQILEEIARYHKINNYIMEQDAPPPPGDPGAPPPPGDPGAPPPPGDPGAAAPAPPGGAPVAPAPPAPVDLEADKEVEKIDDEGKGEEGVEELEITDLVDAQKNILDKQEEYFENLFQQIKTMEEKLSQMDSLVSKIDGLETKIEKMRPKTAKEKLELRSLDSGPFNQKLSDFFDDKQKDIEKSGKNEYVLTTDDVESYSNNEIEDSFNEYDEDDEDNMM